MQLTPSLPMLILLTRHINIESRAHHKVNSIVAFECCNYYQYRTKKRSQAKDERWEKAINVKDTDARTTCLLLLHFEASSSAFYIHINATFLSFTFPGEVNATRNFLIWKRYLFSVFYLYLYLSFALNLNLDNVINNSMCFIYSLL